MLNGFIDSKKIETLAIGNFDGIHLGHRQLLDKLDANSGVLVIEHNKACLTPGVKRTEFIQVPVFFYHLQKVKSLQADAFVRLLQKDFPALKKVIVGYDFVFGYQRKGDATLLQKYFDVEVVQKFCIEGIAVHSRTIKSLLKTDYAQAVQFLGRAYEIEGFHVTGQGMGAKKLVPTMNLSSHYCLPKEGVYATHSFVQGHWYKSVSFIGHRLTTDGKLAIETHLIDTDIQLICANVKIRLIKYLRKNKKFDSLATLKEQIDADIDAARRSV
jgi:riboflavin kinase/FMN adenylyltransferase